MHEEELHFRVASQRQARSVGSWCTGGSEVNLAQVIAEVRPLLDRCDTSTLQPDTRRGSLTSNEEPTLIRARRRHGRSSSSKFPPGDSARCRRDPMGSQA